MKRFIYLTVILIIGLTSCNPKIDFSKIVPSQIDKFAIDFMIEVHKGNLDSCLNLMSNDLKNGLGSQKLNNSHAFIKNYSLDSVRLINANKRTLYGDNGFTDYWVEYEYFLTDKFLYSSIGIREQNGILTIMSFDGSVANESAENAHKFHLKGKGFLHYLFLAFAILIPIFILISLIFVIKTKQLKRKWLWIIGVLFGFIKFSINWTTGQVGFSLINISILGAGYSKSGNIAPWILSFSFPIVAIIFWYKRYWDKKEAEAQKRIDERMKAKENQETNE